MFNLGICYLDVMWTPSRTYLAVFRFLTKCQDSNVYLKIRLYHLIIHVFGKVQGPTSTWDLHNIIQSTCDMTLDLKGVHICHIL